MPHRTCFRAVGCLALTSVVAFAMGCGSADVSEDPSVDESALFEAEPLGPEPEGSPTQYPILLVHGFAGSSTSLMTFTDPIVNALREDGHIVYMGNLPPFAPVVVRAEYLAQDIDHVLAETGAKKVNLIAHSMGGLDAREVVSGPG